MSEHTIFPAAPGWFLMWPVMSDGNIIGLRPEPVIAWAIQECEDKLGSYFYTTPIAPSGCNAITRRPDGSLFQGPELEFDSEQAAIAHLNHMNEAKPRVIAAVSVLRRPEAKP
jgi:hypothetical protein